MRRISETVVCDRCKCCRCETDTGWTVKVIEGKEYDLCAKCAEWFDKLEHGRRVPEPYTPYYPVEPYVPYHPYKPWPPYPYRRDWIIWTGTTDDTTCHMKGY